MNTISEILTLTKKHTYKAISSLIRPGTVELTFTNPETGKQYAYLSDPGSKLNGLRVGSKRHITANLDPAWGKIYLDQAVISPVGRRC